MQTISKEFKSKHTSENVTFTVSVPESVTEGLTDLGESKALKALRNAYIAKARGLAVKADKEANDPAFLLDAIIKEVKSGNKARAKMLPALMAKLAE